MQVYAGVHRRTQVQVHTGVQRHRMNAQVYKNPIYLAENFVFLPEAGAQKYTGVHRCTQVYTGVQRCTQVYTSVHRRTGHLQAYKIL